MHTHPAGWQVGPRGTAAAAAVAPVAGTAAWVGPPIRPSGAVLLTPSRRRPVAAVIAAGALHVVVLRRSACDKRAEHAKAKLVRDCSSTSVCHRIRQPSSRGPEPLAVRGGRSPLWWSAIGPLGRRGAVDGRRRLVGVRLRVVIRHAWPRGRSGGMSGPDQTD